MLSVLCDCTSASPFYINQAAPSFEIIEFHGLKGDCLEGAVACP